MVSRERMQRISFRLADAIQFLIAFALAYKTLLPARNLSLRVLTLFHETDRYLPGLSNPELPSWVDLSWIVVVSGLAVSLILEYGNDSVPVGLRSYRAIAMLQAIAVAIAAGAIESVFLAFHVPLYSRLFVIDYLLLVMLFTCGYRFIAKAVATRTPKAGKSKPRLVLAGKVEGVAAVVGAMGVDLGGQYELLGCLIDGEEPPANLSVPVLGRVDSLGDLLIHQPIDQVLIVLPNGRSPWVATAIEYCDYFRVSVQIVHESLMGVKLNDLMAPGESRPFASIMLRPEEELSSDRLVLKRLIDIAGSLVALLILSPLMLLIAIAIKITTPHLPVLYKWNVVGYRGRRFTGYKFTTMTADADERKEMLSQLNEMTGPVFKIRNDPRVNPLGKFLRKYSLNELPQFWSVLAGDMSLVGPRPAGPHELVKYSLWHKRKLSVRPGITCFWQVRGRNAISNFDDWVRMDLEYIQKRSVKTDMEILVQTVSAVVRGTGS